MRRFSTRTLLAAASAALAAVLLIAGGLALWGSAYVHNTVQGQLAAQQIFFPPASAFAHAKAGTEITPSMIPSVSQYAGQQMLTGQQAEAYADHFIAVAHPGTWPAARPTPSCPPSPWPSRTTPRSPPRSNTVFKGETLRSMLLNAYGWWKVSQIVYIVSLVLFGLGAVAGLGSAYLFAFGRRPRGAGQVAQPGDTRPSPRPRPPKQPVTGNANPHQKQHEENTERPPVGAGPRRHPGVIRCRAGQEETSEGASRCSRCDSTAAAARAS